MGSGEKTLLLQIPKVDFRGLDPGNPGGDGWESVRVQAMQALELFGCVEAIYDGVSPELKDALFGRAMGELFALPLETKRQSASDKPYQGYIGQIPTMAYESLRVDGAPDLEKVEEFARLMWPQGNPNFCQTVCNFAKQVQKLEQMVERMVLQSLGVDKYWTSHTESLAYGVRLAEYGVPLDQETKIAMGSHLDPNMMTIICQHQVKGLEVQTKDGEWIDVEPLPNSFTVMIGEAFGAWTNGRLQPVHHRVRIHSNQKRNSALVGSRPKDGFMVQIPEELIDKEHPLLYKPYDYIDYLKFRFSTENEKAEDLLRAFCGVERTGLEA